MNKVINEILKTYNCLSSEDYKNALKEIVQEITLLGLYRQNFFDKVAFYGGSALRIAYNIDRFSEDLDFTLLKASKNFDISKYFKGLEDEFTSFGLSFKIQKKIKNFDTNIDSAFIKGNTLKHLILIENLNINKVFFNKNDLIKVKIEIDTDPPNPSGNSEVLFSSKIIPYSYRILTKESLFSGKLHAILCRDYKSKRVKGRDFYDFIWFINSKIKPDLKYLEAKMKQSKHLESKVVLSLKILKDLLIDKFNIVDFNEARKDIMPFIKDTPNLEVWSKDFFLFLLNKM